MTAAELVWLAVAQVPLRFDDERHWLRAAARQVGHLFPRLLGQSEYNDRVKALAPLMEAALRWLADHTPRRRFYEITSTGRQMYDAALSERDERRAGWLNPSPHPGVGT